MKKLFLALGLAAVCLSSNAFERYLYKQNFETVATPEAAGWSFGGEKMSIASDFQGKYLDLSLGQNNGRSGQVTWGPEIYTDKDGNPILEDGCYRLAFEFSIKSMPNNQYNSEITIFTNHTPIENNLYRIPWSQKVPAEANYENFIFDLAQVNTAVEDNMSVVINAPVHANYSEEVPDSITGWSYDTSSATTVVTGDWVSVVCDVNVNTRTVEYNVENIFHDPIASGTWNVPENDVNGNPISMYAEGLYTLLARYQSSFLFDNIVISCEVENPYANEPTIALTRLGQTDGGELDLNMRAYTITFVEGEVLHVKGTDGTPVEVEYADCEGSYVYETSQSGTLEAWTTCEGATSEVVTEKVDCTPYALPEVTATISSVQVGYGKTYTLTISNADVALQPTIFINYEFTGVNGEKLAAEGVASGATVSVTQEGTLKLTSEAFGYQATNSTVENNIEFDIKKTWDFARMTADEIKAAGFPEFSIQNTGETSGFTNWTGRKRLYYESSTETVEQVDDDGNVTQIPAKIYPFGFISDDNTTNVLYYTVIDRSATETTEKGEYFEGLTIFPEKGKLAAGALPNVGMIYHVGLYNDQTTNSNNNVYVHDLDASDFVSVNYINNYGGNSNHPTCANDEEYYAQLAGEDAVFSASANGTLDEETGLYNLAYALYRIDTAITKITVFKQLGDAVETIKASEVGDNYWYSIDGVRVAEPTHPGLYIHNGKKYIIK